MAAAAVEMTGEALGKDFTASGRKGRRNALTLDEKTSLPELSEGNKLEMEAKAMEALSLEGDSENNNNDADINNTKK